MTTALDRPQRISIVIERNKPETWGVAAYLIKPNGQRERRCLAICETHDDASRALERVWQSTSA